jgi:hypothetical protein
MEIVKDGDVVTDLKEACIRKHTKEEVKEI